MSRATVEQEIPASAALEEEVRRRLEELREMRVSELQDAYLEVHGKPTQARNRPWLIKRVFFRVQELAERRTLSPAARAKANELAQGQTVRARPEHEGEPPPRRKKARDPRLPPVGTVIRREHEGEVYEITVLEAGFDYEGRYYPTLSTVAREITGTTWNGFLWAGLTTRKKRAAGAEDA
jgi:hypothetical protein